MTVAAGARLGPYEILSPLGAGGMGEVYRARDTRLGREVAIKVLPAGLASDSERLKRFEREAQSASSLNHPNIVTIYDIGSQDSISYIAMELVTGRPLRSVLLQEALPVRQLLQIGVEIAEGLAKAHAAGIVHRDLKPENVMVTEDGHVKILDFGLAKLTQPDGSGAGRTQAPTVSGATEEGIILGTVGYMSPEQATGQSVDYRSDQFAFGSILYEMATGRRAFQRGSAPQTLAAIIQDEPEPIATLNAKVPAPLRWTVQRCLAKEPRKRYASTEDLASELTTIRDNLSEASSAIAVLPAEPVPVRRRRWWIPATIAAAILLFAGTASWRLRQIDYFWKNPLAGALYTRLTDWEGSELDADISPDGKFVAFLSDREGSFDIWVAQVGGGEFVNLTRGRYPTLGRGVVRCVRFSGDGTQVSLHLLKDQRDDGVWLVPTMGGAVRAFLPTAVEVAWSQDGSQIAYHPSDPGDPIFIADRSGGNPRQIFIAKPGIHNHYPTWSSDGRFVYFVQGIPPKNMDIWRIHAKGGATERLTDQNSRIADLARLDARTLIYVATREGGSGSGLFAVDVERGIPHPLTSGIEEYKSVATSADGRRLVSTVANPVRNLWTVPIRDRLVDDSSATRFRLPTVRASNPRFGPDYVLYLSSRGGADGLWKLKDGSETELWKGSDGEVATAPAISPDGARICFAVRGERQAFLEVISADGTNAHRLAEALDVVDTPSWSPDGEWLAVSAKEEKTSPLFKVPATGGPPVRLVEGATFNPVWSPDGRFILYSEAEGGPLYRLRGVTPDKRLFPMPEVWVRYIGNRYRFLPDGKSVVVMRTQGRVSSDFWMLDLATSGLRQLTDFAPGYEMTGFDVSPDGRQILFDRYRENSDVVLIDLPPR